MMVPRRRKRDSFLPWAQFLVDCAAILVVLKAALWIRFSSGLFATSLAPSAHAVYHKSFALIALILLFFIRFYGLYQPSRLLTFPQETWRVTKAVAASILVLMTLTFFIRVFSFSRTFLVLAGVALALGVSLGRFLLGLFVMWVDRKRKSYKNILLIGYDENAKKLANYYEKNPRFGVSICGILDEELKIGTHHNGIPVLGSPASLQDILKEKNFVHEVILVSQGLPTESVLRMIYECEKMMVSFRWIADIFGLIASKMSVSHFGGVQLLSFVDSPLGNWENRFLKRGMDIAVSFFMLFILSPMFIILALWIKKDSSGPIFYKQKRVGEDGKEFSLYKFRTMKVGAEEKTGPVWARENDDRRTRAGVFLRRFNLDEFPQLWNVLMGHMSLVGPRPERPFFVSQFKEDIPRYMARHSIRSGMTGWAQINGLRGNTSIEERTKYDLYYIENWSLFFDIRILFLTAFSLHNSRNAY